MATKQAVKKANIASKKTAKAPNKQVKKEVGNRYQFEGRNLSTDSVVRGEVVAKKVIKLV